MTGRSLSIATLDVVAARRSLANERPESLSADHGLASFGDVQRKLLWDLGRRLVKQHVASVYRSQKESAVQESELLVISRNGFGRGMRPAVFLGGKVLPWSISLAHSDDVIAVAISTDRSLQVGIDLIDMEPTAEDSERLWPWLSEHERILARASGAAMSHVIWGAKEASFKANNYGQAFRPRDWEVACDHERISCAYRGEPLPIVASMLRPVGSQQAIALAFAAKERVSESKTAFHWSTPV